MKKENLNRRDFTKLSAAALGGMVAGTALGVSGAVAADDEKKKEVHVCRGLNACKGNGTDGKNACAGQGACATAKAHGCGGKNECKGQGGCHGKSGENACKGKGGCAVPLGEKAWKATRKKFEERMKKAGKTFGDAPAKKA